MKLLLKYKANPNQIFALHGETPLHGALRYLPDQEKIELLVKSGADLTVKNNNLNTALHIASSFQYPFVLPLLINEDAINCKNIYGSTPLIEALKSLCTGNIRYLLTNDIAIPHLYYGKDNQIHITVLIRKLHDSDNSVLHRRQYRKIAQAIILLEGMYTARAHISKKGIGSNLPADLNKKIGRYLAYEKLTH